MSTTSASIPVGVYSPPASATLEPVAPNERIQALDLLRGWAMFGVLWSNLNDWYAPTDATTKFDRMLGFAQEYLLESRFYTLLCLLFGIGFGLQLARATERGMSIRLTYTRRSAALLAIGLVHGLLIWNGDIVAMYALVSFALLLFRDVTPRRQLAWAIGLYVFGKALINRTRWLLGWRYMVPQSPRATASWIYGHGTMSQIAHQRWFDFADWYGRYGLTTYFSVLAMFLAGCWALRSGYFRRVVSDPRATRRLLGWSVVATLVGYAGTWAIDTNLPRLIGSQATAPTPLFMALNPWPILYSALDPTVANGLVYAALLLLAVQTGPGARLLAPLAAAGRMALTTYLTQSVVSTLLFYGFGLKWFGTVGYTAMLEITLVVFSIQMAASVWWLKRYRFGPAEWLWRTLTYGRPPAMRVTTADA